MDTTCCRKHVDMTKYVQEIALFRYKLVFKLNLKFIVLLVPVLVEALHCQCALRETQQLVLRH